MTTAPTTFLDGTAAPDTAKPRQLPKPVPGPVFIGDIHGSLGGRPLMLLLWDQWEQDMADQDD